MTPFRPKDSIPRPTKCETVGNPLAAAALYKVDVVKSNKEPPKLYVNNKNYGETVRNIAKSAKKVLIVKTKISNSHFNFSFRQCFKNDLPSCSY